MRVTLILGCLLLATSAIAAPKVRNTGAPLTPGAVWGKHDISGSTRVGETMLYCPSESDDAAYRSAIAATTGGTVDYFDTRAATPTLAQLQNYSCVYTWANYAYLDNVAFGNVLAQYVDGGGVVILGSFCTYTSGNFLSGQIMTSAYAPVVSPSGSSHFSLSSYAGDGTSFIYTGNGGVTTFDCTFRDILVLQGAGIRDGTYQDAEIAHAYRPDGNVIYSNGSGASQLGCGGQWPRLLGNACQFGTVPVELMNFVVE